eukprot:scaffold6845_cov41-Tisochrysis_lutea.AAC.1
MICCCAPSAGPAWRCASHWSAHRLSPSPSPCACSSCAWPRVCTGLSAPSSIAGLTHSSRQAAPTALPADGSVMGLQEETLETDPVQLLGAIRQYFDARGNRALDEFNLKDTLGAWLTPRAARSE